jgi:hypothetical protein
MPLVHNSMMMYNPLFIIKNECLTEDILVLKYVPENEDSEENEAIPVIEKLILSA